MVIVDWHYKRYKSYIYMNIIYPVASATSTVLTLIATQTGINDKS